MILSAVELHSISMKIAEQPKKVASDETYDLYSNN